MPLCKWSSEVECSTGDSFDYIADWRHFKDYLPFFVDLKVTSVVEYGPGASYEVTIALGRVGMVTVFDVVEFVKNKRLLLKASRGLRSKISWDLRELPRKTVLTFAFEYEIPPGLVTRASEREAIEKELQEHAENSMRLLKWVLESKTLQSRG